MKLKGTIRLLFNDIRFWIFLFALIRLIGITHPPIDISHGWRQSYTAMVARNFYEDGPQLLLPSVDHMGPDRSVTASEFPLFNYLIYLISVAFGYAHWYGRLINLVVSSFGIWCFFKITEYLTSRRTALISALLLITSIWFAFSRKIMPDTFSASLVLTGVYYALLFIRKGRYPNLLIYLLMVSLGMLSKLPSMVLLSFIFVFLLTPWSGWQRKAVLVAVTFMAFLPPAWWYFSWVPHLVNNYHNPLFFPRDIITGAQELMSSAGEATEKFYFSAFQSFMAFGFFLLGIYMIIRRKQTSLLVVFGVSFALFLVFMIKAGIIFSWHNYYIIPFVPVMALIAGFGIAEIRKDMVVAAILVVLMGEGIANQFHDLRFPDSQQYKTELETVADSISGTDTYFIINGGLNPQLMYFLHRKGWSLEPESACDEEMVRKLSMEGASFLLIDKHLARCDLGYSVVYESEDVVVYRLGYGRVSKPQTMIPITRFKPGKGDHSLGTHFQSSHLIFTGNAILTSTGLPR